MDGSGPTWWEIFAGACGAIVPIAFRSGLSPRQVVAMGFIGLAFAVFATPALFNYYHVTNPEWRAAIIFTVGMGGMRAAEAILTWWSINVDGLVAGALSSFSRSRHPNKQGKERRKSRDRRKKTR